MRKQIFALAAMISHSVALALWAQGHGRGGGGGDQHGQRPSTTGPERRGQQGQQPGMHDQQRQRIHATDQQRDQHRTCTQSAERVRSQARQMAEAAKGGGANNPEFREQHQRLREEILAMQQEHERFIQSMSEEQRAAMQDRIRKMDQARERLHTQLQGMDQELRQANPDPKRLETQAREMERATKEWQKQYRSMGSDMGIEP